MNLKKSLEKTLKMSSIVLQENIREVAPSDESVKGLSISIQQNGLLQPVVVTKRKDKDKYILVLGHRRFRACQILKHKEIEAKVVKQSLSKDQVLFLQIAENLQRENLRPVARAKVFKLALEKTGKTQRELGAFLGIDHSVISKSLKLLDLSDEIKKFIDQENLSMRLVNVLVACDERKRSALFELIKNGAVKTEKAALSATGKERGEKPPEAEKKKERPSKQGKELDITLVKNFLKDFSQAFSEDTSVVNCFSVTEQAAIMMLAVRWEKYRSI